MDRKMKRIIVAVCLALYTISGSTHHVRFEFFDTDTTIEIEGRVSSLKWSNPHVLLGISVTSATGETGVWRAEFAALNAFGNRGITEPVVEVGEKVVLYGYPAREGHLEISALNLLREDGTEILLSSNALPYFASRTIQTWSCQD